MVLLNKILKKSVLVGAVLGALALTPPAAAATSSLVGGTADVLPGNFNPAPGSGGAARGEPFVTFSSVIDGGHSHSGHSTSSFLAALAVGGYRLGIFAAPHYSYIGLDPDLLAMRRPH